MPIKTKPTAHIDALLIFAAGVLLLLPSIWSETSITGQDEYWLSLRTPMESLARGDWFTPWVNGEPRLKKPPLLYWAICLSYKLLGINLFAARIWGVLFGSCLAVSATLLYRQLFKKRGLLAGLITLGTISVAVEGRRAMLDLPLAFFTAMAVCFALRWGMSGRRVWMMLAALSLGLSFLVKGPVGIILFGVAAVSGLFIFRKWSFAYANRYAVLWAGLLVLAVSLPWPVAMASLWPDFLGILSSEVAARGIGTVYVGSPFSTLGGAFGLVFPWSLVLLAALIRSIGTGPTEIDRNGLWLSVWFVGCIIPFFFIRSFARYMTPLIPAAAVLCAHWLDLASGVWKTVILKISISLMAVVSILFCLFFIWFGLGVPMAVLCLAAVGVMLWAAFAGKDIHLVAGSVALLLSLLLGGLYPSLGINAMPADLHTRIGSQRIAAFNSSQPSMLSIRMKRSALQIRSFVQTDVQKLKEFDGMVFVRDPDTGRFEALAETAGLCIVRAGRFRTLYSRQAWIRFVREDATVADWKKAFLSRSLEGLMPAISYYRVWPCNALDPLFRWGVTPDPQHCRLRVARGSKM